MLVPFLLFGGCGQVASEPNEDETGTGGEGGTKGEPQACAGLSETACVTANRDSLDELDDCKWVEPIRLGHIEEGAACSERDEGACTPINGTNCGDQDARTYWTDESGTVWSTHNGCGLPEFERYSGSSRDLFPCDDSGGDGDVSQRCNATSQDECHRANDGLEIWACNWVTLVRIGHSEEGRVCSELPAASCVYDPDCGDQDAETLWTDEGGTIWRTNDSCGLPGFERYTWRDDVERFPCVGAESIDCATFSGRECETGNGDTEDELDDCRWVTHQRVGHIEDGGTCSAAATGTCTELHGKNCGDQDAETHWVDDSGTVWRTYDGCGLPEFERYEGSSEDIFSCGGAGGAG
ncbi:MAG TPA: hypothetical protein VN764_10625, partial [Polyangiaceae bacterium]|nr:hypothetical protein [Polyangiaceae bacterium]